jgi:hypothetical protein
MLKIKNYTNQFANDTKQPKKSDDKGNDRSRSVTDATNKSERNRKIFR